MKMTLHAASPSLEAVLAAFAEEARPFIAGHRRGKITVNFSGGSSVRIEVSQYRDIPTEKELPR